MSDNRTATGGHWQISPRALNQLPAGEFSSDRFDATGIKLLDREPKPDGYVLICGQVPEDAAVMDVDYPAWLRYQWDYWTARGEQVFFRPHPKSLTQAISVPKSQIKQGDLSHDLNGAKLVVCYNSNAGHDALIAGVPVYCSDTAPYAELSGEVCPSIEERRRYFSRAAYGQWKIEEMDQGVITTLERMGYGSRI